VLHLVFRALAGVFLFRDAASNVEAMNELEERWRDLGEFIREQRHVGQLSLRKLSEMAGISNPYLSQIERGLRKPSAEILRQIAQALSISAETLYVRAGILDARDGEADLVSEIRRDPFIDEEQKKTLVHIYLSFRAERADRLVADELLDDPTFVQTLLEDPDLLEPASSGTASSGTAADGGSPAATAADASTAGPDRPDGDDAIDAPIVAPEAPGQASLAGA
jgi:transcriptional regulator with XRE-family HTH domain